MSKMKTRKSVAKRYKLTAGGKVLYKKKGLRHILTKKSSKRKRHLGKRGVLSPVEVARVRQMLPYA